MGASVEVVIYKFARFETRHLVSYKEENYIRSGFTTLP